MVAIKPVNYTTINITAIRPKTGDYVDYENAEIATALRVGNASGVTAAGSVQTDATPLVDVLNILTSVGVGTGVILPQCKPGRLVIVINTQANNVKVYPAIGENIGPNAANANALIGTYFAQVYTGSSTGEWGLWTS